MLTFGNLGCRKLLVLLWKMLPFFLPALLPEFFLIIFSILGTLLSWNKLRDNTATTHRSNFFW